jgi:hypothetical protein
MPPEKHLEDTEDTAARVDQFASTHAPEIYAGIASIDSSTIMLALTERSSHIVEALDALLPAEMELKVHLVQHNLRELSRIAAELEDELVSGQTPLVAVGVDVSKNRVIVMVKPGSRDTKVRLESSIHADALWVVEDDVIPTA